MAVHHPIETKHTHFRHSSSFLRHKSICVHTGENGKFIEQPAACSSNNYLLTYYYYYFFKQPFAWKKFRGREDFSPISVHYGIQAEVTPSIIILYWSESSYPRSPDCHISFACVVSAFYMCSIACVSVRHTLHVKYMSTRGQCCLSGLILIKWMLWGVVWYRL